MSEINNDLGQKSLDYFLPDEDFDNRGNIDVNDIDVLNRVEKETKDKKNSSVEYSLNEFIKEIKEVFDAGIFGFSTYGEVLQNLELAEVQRNKFDPQVRASLKTLIYNSFKKVPKFTVANEEPESLLYKEYCDILIDELQDSMKTNISTILASIMDTSLYYGHCIGEKNYKNYSDLKFESKRVFRSLKVKRPKQIAFKMSVANDILAINNLMNDDVYPKEKFFWVTCDEEFDNPYGNGICEYVNKLAWAKNKIFQQYLISLAKKAQQTTLIKVDDDQDDNVVSQAKKIGRVIQKGGTVIYGSDINAETQILDEVSEGSYIQAMDWIDGQITKTIIGNTLSTNEAQGSGSFAQSQTHMEVTYTFSDFIELIALSFLKHHIIVPNLKYNFEYNKLYLPKIELELPNKKEVVIDASTISILRQNGFISEKRLSDVNKIRSQYGFSKLEEKDLINNDSLIPNEQIPV